MIWTLSFWGCRVITQCLTTENNCLYTAGPPPLQAARLPWVLFSSFHQYTTPQPYSVPGSVLGGEATGNLLLSGCPCWGERPWPWWDSACKRSCCAGLGAPGGSRRPSWRWGGGGDRVLGSWLSATSLGLCCGWRVRGRLGAYRLFLSLCPSFSSFQRSGWPLSPSIFPLLHPGAKGCGRQGIHVHPPLHCGNISVPSERFLLLDWVR